MRTKTAIIVICALCAPIVAQNGTADRLERARVLEELEHDADGAIAIYRAVARDAKVSDEGRGQAWLRLGLALQRAGDGEGARAALTKATALGGEAGGRAAEVLQDPDGDDRKRKEYERARELLRSFRSAVANERPGPVEKYEEGEDLIWMGEAAMPAILDSFRAARKEPYGETVISQLARLIWRIGGDRAREFIAAARQSDDEELRRHIAAGIAEAQTEAMVAEAQKFLADDEPWGVVVKAALGVAPNHQLLRRYDVMAVLPLLDDERQELRELVYRVLAQVWYTLSHAEGMMATARQCLPRILRDVDSVDPRLARSASQLLVVTGPYTRAGRAALISRMPGLTFPMLSRIDGEIEPIGATESVDEILALLGRAAGLDFHQANPETSGVRAVVAMHVPAWSIEALPAVLAAMDLGLVNNDWLRENATIEHAEVVTAALPTSGGANHLLDWLNSFESLPAGCYEPLRKYATKVELDGNLAVAIGKTGHPEAPTYLQSRLVETKGSGAAAVGLLYYSEVAPGEDAMAGLRAVLAADDNAPNSTTAGRAFIQLVRLGDARLPEVANKAPNFSPLRPRFGHTTGDLPVGLGWLTYSWIEDGERGVWHGYTPEAYAKVIADLCDLEDGRTLGWLLAESLFPSDKRMTRRYGMLLPSRFDGLDRNLLRTLTRLWTEVARGERRMEGKLSLAYLLHIANQRMVEDPEILGELARLHELAVRSVSAEVRLLGLEMVPDTPSEEQRGWIRTAIGDSDLSVAERARQLVRANGIAISRELVATGLTSESDRTRCWVIERLAPFAEDSVIDLVRAGLRDPSVSVRVAACRFLGAQMDPDGIADLLEAYRDPQPNVREAAADALSAIRFYHDEKTHWQKVFSGEYSLTPEGAAEALLAKARPGNEVETRILAIRSLASLGKPEVLPYLIDWTADPAAEVAMAARAAIDKLHGDGNPPK